MDQATREFLIWFDGFCENVDEVPTAKQWNRVLMKIGEMADLAKAEPAPVPVSQAVPALQPTGAVPVAESVEPPSTVVQLPQVPRDMYRIQYRQRLKELGIDDESDLNDFVRLAMEQYNVNLDPRKEATRFFNTMFPGTNAAGAS